MKNTNTSVREVAANIGELLRKHGVIDAAAIDDPEGYDNYDMLGRLLRVAEEQARINESTPPATLPPVGATPEQLEEAEKLGYRDGKEGVTVPPAEWCEDSDEMQTVLRVAWVRGCKSGMSVTRQNVKGQP